MNTKDWVVVRRGFGKVDLSSLGSDEFVTASGLHDGGYIVWKHKTPKVREGHPIRALSDSGVDVVGARLTESDIAAMLETLDEWEVSLPCWKWREWQFSELDVIRAHAMGVVL